MTKEELSYALREIAQVKKQTANNPFSAKSYQRAADIIDGLSEPIEFHDFPSIKGLGPKICGSIREFLDAGKIQWLEENRKEHLTRSTRHFNTMLSEIALIHGIGSKKAKLIYQETGILKIKDLKLAIEKGGLTRIFKPKTIENIKQQLQYGGEKKMKREEGLKIANKIKRSLKSFYDVMNVMGSYRRKKEMVGDIDFMVKTSNSELLMEQFCSLKYVEKVKQGPKVSQVRFLKTGTKIDLYVFEEENWGSAQQFLTGSGEHNRLLRITAMTQGKLLNRYGVWNRKKTRRYDNGSEESVYDVLGFNWIPPKERNGTDEYIRYKK